MSSGFLTSNNRWLAFVLLTLTTLFWGGNAIVARGFYMDIPPVSLAFWRWSLASMIVIVISWRQLRRDWSTIIKSWRIMLLLSLLGIALFNTLLYQGAHTTSAINLSLVQTTMPLIVIVLCYVMYRERITGLQTVGVLFALAGGIVTISRGNLEILLGLKFVSGDLWMLLAMVIYALYSVLLRERPKIHPMSFVSATFLIGSLLLLPFYLWERTVTEASITLSPALFGSVAYLAVFPSILAYLFWNYGVSVIGPTLAGLFVTLVPVFATAMSLMFLDDPLELFHIVGLVCIVAGIVLANMKKAAGKQTQARATDD